MSATNEPLNMASSQSRNGESPATIVLVGACINNTVKPNKSPAFRVATAGKLRQHCRLTPIGQERPALAALFRLLLIVVAVATMVPRAHADDLSDADPAAGVAAIMAARAGNWTETYNHAAGSSH